MIHDWYGDLYFFIIRLCMCVISVLIFRGTRAVKLRKKVFPSWAGFAMVVDVVITTKPPWVERHEGGFSPRHLLSSLVVAATLQWPLIWWMYFMETRRRGLALTLAMAMLFHRSSAALVLFRRQYTSSAHAVLALLYLWCTLSSRAVKRESGIEVV